MFSRHRHEPSWFTFQNNWRREGRIARHALYGSTQSLAVMALDFQRSPSEYLDGAFGRTRTFNTNVLSVATLPNWSTKASIQFWRRGRVPTPRGYYAIRFPGGSVCQFRHLSKTESAVLCAISHSIYITVAELNGRLCRLARHLRSTSPVSFLRSCSCGLFARGPLADLPRPRLTGSEPIS